MSFSDFNLTSQVAYALQLALGFIFLIAVIPKLRDRRAFTRNVIEYQLLPRELTSVVAQLIIAIEAFLAISLLSGWMTTLALPVATLVLAAFTAAVTVSLRRGQRIPCGCFGGAGEHISRRSLVRLLLLLMAAFLLMVVPPGHVNVGRPAREGASAFAYLVQAGGLAAAMIIAATWLLNLPELAFVLRHLQRTGDDAGRAEAARGPRP